MHSNQTKYGEQNYGETAIFENLSDSETLLGQSTRSKYRESNTRRTANSVTGYASESVTVSLQPAARHTPEMGDMSHR